MKTDLKMSSIDRTAKGNQNKDNIHADEQTFGSDEEYANEVTINNQQVASLSTKKALWAYLILCFSVRIIQETWLLAALLIIESRPAQPVPWPSTMSRQLFSLQQTPSVISQDQTSRALVEGILNA